MINDKNLSILYDGVISEKELTTKELKSYGFNSKDLSKLIENKVLERVKRGHYSFLAINDLFNYGKQLIANKEYAKSATCFKICNELAPKHPGACFQLFLRSIQSKDYESAFKYFSVLEDTNNIYYSTDNNFYLYLLSVITNIPDQYKCLTKHLAFEDIKVNPRDKRYKDKTLQNKIRIAALKQKFPFALKQLNDLIASHGSTTVQDLITKTLLSQAIAVENSNKKALLTLINNKEYTEVISFLEKKQNQYTLSLIENATLKLAKEIVAIQETKKIPKPLLLQEINLFNAIDRQNYKAALKLFRNNLDNSNNSLGLLLIDLCDLLNQIELSSKNTVIAPTNPIDDALKANIEEFIENKYKALLKHKGMILLKHTTDTREKIIHEIVERYPDLRSFNIGKGDKKQVVIKYSPFIKEEIDIKELSSRGSTAYNQGDYHSCIEDYLQILQLDKIPHARVYARLGLAYLKQRNINLAIDYLTVATEISKLGKGSFDFTDLIAALKGQYYKVGDKPRVRMNCSDFCNDVENHYGIENMDEITTLISESGIDVESAGEQLGMSKEKINKVRLIYAKEYYSQGFYDKGDQFLKAVEQSEDKSKNIINLCNTIQKNKRFYPNRLVEKPRQLSLKWQPSKINK